MNRVLAYVLMLLAYFIGCLVGNTFELSGTTAYVNIVIAISVFLLFSIAALVSSAVDASRARKKKRLAKMVPARPYYPDHPHR